MHPQGNKPLQGTHSHHPKKGCPSIFYRHELEAPMCRRRRDAVLLQPLSALSTKPKGHHVGPAFFNFLCRCSLAPWQVRKAKNNQIWLMLATVRVIKQINAAGPVINELVCSFHHVEKTSSIMQQCTVVEYLMGANAAVFSIGPGSCMGGLSELR